MSETMKQQFGLIKRSWGVYYLKNKTTGEQTSLKTRDWAEAEKFPKVVDGGGWRAVVIGRVHALEGGGTKSGWKAANRRVGQDLDASVWPFKTKLRHPDRASAMVQRRFLFAFFDPQHPG